MSSPNHDFHLVDASLWPFVSSIAAGVLTGGGVAYLHGITPIVMIIGFVLVLATMFLWWRDVTNEAEHQGHHKPIVQLGLRYGMLFFIASEVMFFVAFFWAFFDFSIFPREATGGVWPPEGVRVFDPMDLPLYNTIILLSSGTTVTWAHHALREGDRKSFQLGLGVTILLGILFTCVQGYEYYHAAHDFWGIGDGIYPTTFYLATGFHGFHVIIGTLFLTVCWLRGMAGHFKPNQHFGFEAAAWYWHFVDVVWLFLYVAVYWGIFAASSGVAAH